MTLAESAAREAFEEAGVTGEIAASPLGAYHYLKERKDGGAMPCSVDVFALQVTQELDDWPEKGTRELSWLPLTEAAAFAVLVAAGIAKKSIRPFVVAFLTRTTQA